MPKAYTYIIERASDGKRYIGYRCQNVRLGIEARDDLGASYLTSSAVVRQEWEADPFTFSIVEITEHDSKAEAMDAELDLFDRHDAIRSPDYLNKNWRRGPDSVEARPVLAVNEAGEVLKFPSVSQAIKAHGRGVENALLGNCKTLHGYVWMYADSPKAIGPDTFLSNRAGRRVLAWKGGEIVAFYETQRIAADAIGHKYGSNISDCAAGRGAKSGGYAWTFADEYDEDRYESESVETVGLEEAIDEGPEAAMIEREELTERLDMLKAALDSMTEKQREAFVLIRIDGKTWAEARATLSVTSSAIAQRLEGAEKKIEKVLQDR